MDWINSVLSSQQAGLPVIAAVFILGIISVFGCSCNYAIIGTVAGYTGTVSSTGKTKTVILSSIFFLIEVVTAMSAVGCIIAFAREFINTSMGNFWKIGAGIISILFGVYTLDIMPFKIPGISVNIQNKKSGIFRAILFGFIIGGLTSLSSLCCNPMFLVVTAASFVKGSMLWGFTVLFAYSVGYGITLASTMLGVGLGLGKISNFLTKFAVVLKYGGGISLIIFGFYYLLTF